jgi:hypothetical protein
MMSKPERKFSIITKDLKLSNWPEKLKKLKDLMLRAWDRPQHFQEDLEELVEHR